MNSQYKCKKITSSNQNTLKNKSISVNGFNAHDLPETLIDHIAANKISYIILRDNKKNNVPIRHTYLQIQKLNSGLFERNEWYENNKAMLQEKSMTRFLDTKDTSYFSNRVDFSKSKMENIHKIISFIEYNIEFFLAILENREAHDTEIKIFYEDLKKSTHQKTLDHFLQALIGNKTNTTTCIQNKLKGLKDGNRELMFNVLDQHLELRSTLEVYMENYHASSIKDWYKDHYPDKDSYIKWLSHCKNKAVTLPLRLKIFDIYRSQLPFGKKISAIHQAYIDSYWELREKSFLGISNAADELENIINNKMLYFVPHHITGHTKPVINENETFTNDAIEFISSEISKQNNKRGEYFTQCRNTLYLFKNEFLNKKHSSIVIKDTPETKLRMELILKNLINEGIDLKNASELLNHTNIEDYRLKLPLIYVTQQLNILFARIKANDDTAYQTLEELKQKIEKICEDKLFLYYQDPENQCIAIQTTLEKICKAAKDKARQTSYLPSFLSFFPNDFQSNLADTLEKFNNEVMTPLIHDLKVTKELKR